MPPEPTDAVALLEAWSQGDERALDALLPLVYDELRAIARRYLRAERQDHTLQTTALVHEAYLRLIGQRTVEWRSRAQLLGLAAQMMRRVLINHALARKADKRDPGTPPVTLEDAPALGTSEPPDLLALNEALSELERISPRQGRIVELRYFGGLSIEEVAAALDISSGTVKRDWSSARLFLRRAIETGSGS